MPKVSVLLPTYNAPHLLKIALDSVLQQDLGDLECLVVCDGCTDHTAEMVRSYTDPRVVCYDLPKAPGFGYANRNIAMKKASGEYMSYMTHDNVMMKDHLSTAVATLEQERQLDIVFMRSLYVSRELTIVPNTFALHDPVILADFLDLKRNRIHSDCTVHRRSCFERFGYWDATLERGGDWEYWRRVIKNGGPNNFRQLNHFSLFRFIAFWRDRTSEVSGVWKRFYQECTSETLTHFQLSSEEGVSEQQVIWDMCQKPDFVCTLRENLYPLLELFAIFQDRILSHRLRVINNLEKQIENYDQRAD